MDVHAETAAVLLEQFLGPGNVRSQHELVSAEGTLRRADAARRPAIHTWNSPYNFRGRGGQGSGLSQARNQSNPAY